MNTMNNPYIGPRTFLKEEGHLFFGRDREARDLAALVISENLVLFYAQSGAGKSSIINTRLIPELEKNLYEVLPVARVSGEVPDGLEVENIFAYNLMRSLIQREIDPASLAGLSLAQFMAKLNEDEEGYFYDTELVTPFRNNPELTPWPRALVIDQFEEIFNTHLGAWDKRDGFFTQLAEAMQADPQLWVVLVMREDYIAYLDPYAHLLPNGLRVRYYMQRLGREAAIKAVKSPTEKLRPYAIGVAKKLVENLAGITVQSVDGQLVVVPGQYIEPVQLQVVCHGLWENLPAEGTEITDQDLQEVGDVNQSLERYYDGRVSAVANENNVPERSIREWFERELITIAGTRNMVLYDPTAKSGLDDRVVRALEGGLIHADLRAGQVWYELSHDRLVDPVRNSNAKWFEQNLSVFQRQAKLWNQQDRSEGLLLRGDELAQAEKDAASLEMTEDERAFLDACHNLHIREQRERRRNVLLTMLAIGATIAMIVAGVFWTKAQNAASDAQIAAVTAQAASTEALEQQNIAEQQKAAAQVAEQDAEAARAETESTLKETEIELRKARNQQLSAQAELTSQSYPSRSLLLALEAIKINTDANEPVTYTAKQALLNGLKSSVGIPLSGNTSDILILKVGPDPDGRWLVTGAKNGEILIWDRESADFLIKPAHIIQTGISEFKYLVFSGDNKTLAAAGNGQNIYLLNLSDADPLDSMITLKTDLPAIEGLEASSNGKWLATGTASSTDRKVLLWNLETIWQEKTTNPLELSIFNGDIQQDISFVKFSLAFSPDSKFLVASDGYHSKVWGFPLIGNPILQEQIDDTFHPPDSLILAWHKRASYYLPSLESAQIHWIGFSPNSRQIIAGTSLSIRDANPRVFIWPVNSFNTYNFESWWWQPDGVSPNGFPINQVWNYDVMNLSPDGRWLATSSGSDIFVHNLEENTSFLLRDHQGPISNLEFSHDSRWLFSASPLGNGDGTARLWDMAATDVRGSAKVYTISSEISATDMDPRGEWVAISSENQLVRLLPINTSGKDWKEYYASIMGLEKNGLEFHDLQADGIWDSYGYSFRDTEGISYSNRFSIVNGQPYLDEGGWFSSDGQWLIQASGEVNVLNLQEKGFVPTKYNVPFACNGIVGYFKDNSNAYVNCGDGGSVLFNLEDRPVKGKPLDGIKALAGSPDGKWLAGWFSGTKSDLAIFDLSQEDITNNPIVLMPYAKDVQSARFSSDSKWVAISKFPEGKTCGVNEVGEYGCPSERNILIWNFLKGDPKVPDYSLTVPEPEKMIISKDGRWIGILSSGVGKLLDLSQSPVTDFDFQTFVPAGTILQMSFSQDSRWLALLDDSGHITLVNLQTTDLKTINVNSLFYKVTYMNFASNSDVLTGTTEFDDTLIWDLSYLFEGSSIIPLVSTIGKYTTSDEKWLFSLNYDDLLKAVCPSIGRNLTRSEWNQYGFTEDYRATCPQFGVEP